MTNKITQFFLLFVVILVLAGFSLVLSKKPKSPLPPEGKHETADNPEQIAALVVEKSYVNDAHTFSGSLVVDEPCSMLSADVDVTIEEPEKITLLFDTRTAGSACDVSSAKKDFIIVVPASFTAELDKVVFNGAAIAFEVRSE